MTETFEGLADRYDRWYETPEGRILFAAEVDCLRPLLDRCPGRWVEVGVGTGRFASSLGVGVGIDVSAAMLGIAQSRGIAVARGDAGWLPFHPASFDGILMALTVCFLAELRPAFRECHQALKTGGCLLLGFVPADSTWGQDYIRRGAEGNPFYSVAYFRTVAQVMEPAQEAGFSLAAGASTLLWNPGETPRHPRVEERVVPGAGFAGLLLRKAAPE